MIEDLREDKRDYERLLETKPYKLAKFIRNGAEKIRHIFSF